MVKTNAERQAEYRLRQQGQGDKKRLNIWLSSRAHKELSQLAKRKGMSQQVLIEWLLTNDPSLEEVGDTRVQSTAIASRRNAEKLLRNDSPAEGGDKARVKKERANELLRNSVSEAAVRRSEEQLDQPVESKPSLPPVAQLELNL